MHALVDAIEFGGGTTPHGLTGTRARLAVAQLMSLAIRHTQTDFTEAAVTARSTLAMESVVESHTSVAADNGVGIGARGAAIETTRPGTETGTGWIGHKLATLVNGIRAASRSGPENGFV